MIKAGGTFFAELAQTFQSHERHCGLSLESLFARGQSKPLVFLAALAHSIFGVALERL
jgi:hypothetical protein